MKKVIGVYADTFNGKVGQSMAYMQFLGQFGNLRMITPQDDLREVAKNIDALVIPGGADVDVHRYNGVPGVMDSRVNQHYEYLDRFLLPLMIDLKKPIIGICRGLQSLNVHFGGTLNSHIVGHHQGDNRTSTKQEIQFEDGSSYMVNSMHHQSIDILGEGLEIVAYGQMFQGCYGNKRHIRNWFWFDEKNKKSSYESYIVIEMIKHAHLPIIAFQWHPEEFNCKIAVENINALLGINEKKVSRTH